MPTHDSINKRLERMEQEQAAAGDHGPRFVIHYTAHWQGPDTSDPYDPDSEDYGTYKRALSAREERATFDAVIAQIRTETIAVNAPPDWNLSVRMADDGDAVECFGAPWWPETPRGEERFWGQWGSDGWRRYPSRGRSE
jgi:hypothetical protein